MRTICFVFCVILAAPLSAEAQDRKPKTTLLHFSNPSQYFDYIYGPDLLNIPELRAGSVGLMPPGCKCCFHKIIHRKWGAPQAQQTFVIVDVECPCGAVRQLYLKVTDQGDRFAKCQEGDALAFDGKFRVVANGSIEPGLRALSIEGADNNASVFPAKQAQGQK